MKTVLKFFTIIGLFTLTLSNYSCSNSQILEEEEMEQVVPTLDKMSWGGEDED
jgi:hypothetical protein